MEFCDFWLRIEGGMWVVIGRWFDGSVGCLVFCECDMRLCVGDVISGNGMVGVSGDWIFWVWVGELR